jgi:uncharacterized membrane protein YgdD (TMEM256/DUF423 family)
VVHWTVVHWTVVHWTVVHAVARPAEARAMTNLDPAEARSASAVSPSQRALAAVGALLAAMAVALAAYAAHAADGDTRSALQTAAAFAFGHGVALAALAPQTTRRLGRLALAALLLGTLLFSGSLAAAHTFATPTRLAPVGGLLMIGGWLLYAVHALRR